MEFETYEEYLKRLKEYFEPLLKKRPNKHIDK